MAAVFTLMENENKILIGKQYAEILQLAICNAKKTVKMIVFCWSIQEERKCDELLKINNAIRHTLRSGILVQCLNGSEGLTRQLIAMNLQAKCLTNFKITHAKFILIDDQILFIGSHNLTKCAMVSNLEISMRHEFESVDNEAATFFDKLWATS
jgi:phosphatidylserine/phosphatidylglycerophosphate/cardiolipin synthase-like enzyme